MKFKPTTPGNPQREKTKFIVTIEDDEFTTSAYTPESALSNAAYRFADENDEDVALVKWKIKQELLHSSVEEV